MLHFKGIFCQFILRGIYINPKGGGGQSVPLHCSGAKCPIGQEIDCHFSQNHARVKKIIDFVYSQGQFHGQLWGQI